MVEHGAGINDTLINYLENIIRYMEYYDYKIILTSDENEEEVILNSIEEFKNWASVGEIADASGKEITKEKEWTQLGCVPKFYKNDLIIIEFYENYHSTLI